MKTVDEKYIIEISRDEINTVHGALDCLLDILTDKQENAPETDKEYYVRKKAKMLAKSQDIKKMRDALAHIVGVQYYGK